MACPQQIIRIKTAEGVAVVELVRMMFFGSA